MCLRLVCRYECEWQGSKHLYGLWSVNIEAGGCAVMFGLRTGQLMNLYLTYD